MANPITDKNKKGAGRPAGGRNKKYTQNVVRQASKLNRAGVDAVDFLNAVMMCDAKKLEKYGLKADCIPVKERIAAAKEILKQNGDANKELEKQEADVRKASGEVDETTPIVSLKSVS